ncbi:MAG: c-type cytochrome [Bdellovibrionales bacterium]|nr:c-type cytochrome [Bdellovibrionales bacterium]
MDLKNLSVTLASLCAVSALVGCMGHGHLEIPEIEPTNSAAVVLTEDLSPEQVARGEEIYKKNCSGCHGPDAKGLVGPNLRDGEWMHGEGSLEDIAKVVAGGVNAMPAWLAPLGESGVEDVTVFVKSLGVADALAAAATPEKPLAVPQVGESVVDDESSKGPVESANAPAPSAGQVLFEQKCSSCHGLKGYSMVPNFPHLAGQQKVYLVDQLKNFRSGQRVNPIMQGMAAALTDEEIEKMSEYLSGLN